MQKALNESRASCLPNGYLTVWPLRSALELAILSCDAVKIFCFRWILIRVICCITNIGVTITKINIIDWFVFVKWNVYADCLLVHVENTSKKSHAMFRNLQFSWSSAFVVCKNASSLKYNSTSKNIMERWSTYFKSYISPKLSQIAQSTTSFFVFQRFEVKVEEGCVTCRIICGLIAF